MRWPKTCPRPGVSYPLQKGNRNVRVENRYELSVPGSSRSCDLVQNPLLTAISGRRNLRRAIERVGPMAEDVRKTLGK